LITGASGFIGGWLSETLCLEGLVEVRAGVRSWSSAPRLARFPLEVVLCDVMDPQQITRAMTGATVVIHCATGLRDVIVQGTQNVLDVALKLGVQRFVHLSTAEVYGNVSGKVDEKFPYQHMGSAYGDAKIDAEKLCWEYFEKGLPLTVFRPSIVYGPFSKDWTVRLAQRLQSGNWGIFDGYGGGNCNLVYVTDLVSAILSSIRREQAIGEAFNLNGTQVITWNQYFQKFNAALGFPRLKVINPSTSKLRARILRPVKSSARFVLDHFEDPLKKAYARSREVRSVMQFAERSIKTTASDADLRLYSRRAVYLASKAQEMLDYRPEIDVDTGLQMSAAWLNHLELMQ